MNLIAKQFEKLEDLSIARTKITPDGVRDIASNLPHLKVLTVDEMDRDALVKFKTSHRDCHIGVVEQLRGGVTQGAFELTEEEKKLLK